MYICTHKNNIDIILYKDMICSIHTSIHIIAIIYIDIDYIYIQVSYPTHIKFKTVHITYYPQRIILSTPLKRRFKRFHHLLPRTRISSC